MSQKKMEQYKEYKKNKKAILAREKRNKKLAAAGFVGALLVFTLCIVLVFGSAIFQAVKNYRDSIPSFDYVADNRVVGDMVGVLETETETGEDKETEKETSDASKETAAATEKAE